MHCDVVSDTRQGGVDGATVQLWSVWFTAALHPGRRSKIGRAETLSCMNVRMVLSLLRNFAISIAVAPAVVMLALYAVQLLIQWAKHGCGVA